MWRYQGAKENWFGIDLVAGYIPTRRQVHLCNLQQVHPCIPVTSNNAQVEVLCTTSPYLAVNPVNDNDRRSTVMCGGFKDLNNILVFKRTPGGRCE